MVETDNWHSEDCGIIFSKTSKKRKRSEEATAESLEEANIERLNSLSKGVHVAKRQRRSSDFYRPLPFKNLRIPEAPDSANTRTWTDLRVPSDYEAELLGVSWFTVFLHKTNGCRISVPFDALAEVDKKFILELPQIPWVSELTLSDWQRSIQDAPREPGQARRWSDITESYTAKTGFLGFRSGKVELHEINHWKLLVDVSRVSAAELVVVLPKGTQKWREITTTDVD
jgi:SLA1 homology domain 1, SHD1